MQFLVVVVFFPWNKAIRCDIPFFTIDLRDTLNPNDEGYSRKSLWINVDLPPPDGPDITTGLLSVAASIFKDRSWRRYLEALASGIERLVRV